MKHKPAHDGYVTPAWGRHLYATELRKPATLVPTCKGLTKANQACGTPANASGWCPKHRKGQA